MISISALRRKVLRLRKERVDVIIYYTTLPVGRDSALAEKREGAGVGGYGRGAGRDARGGAWAVGWGGGPEYPPAQTSHSTVLGWAARSIFGVSDRVGKSVVGHVARFVQRCRTVWIVGKKANVFGVGDLECEKGRSGGLFWAIWTAKKGDLDCVECVGLEDVARATLRIGRSGMRQRAIWNAFEGDLEFGNPVFLSL